MNKQELIEKINNLQYSLSWNIPRINKETVLDLIEQLDEPQLVKVPSVVARWIGYAKGWNKSLHYALSNASDEVLEWLCVDKLKRQEIFARAWLDGYDVEKEKRYLVKFKGFNPSYIILKYHPYDKSWFLGREQEYNFFRQHHTRHPYHKGALWG